MKRFSILLIAIITAGLISSCSVNRQHGVAEYSREQLKILLESGQEIKRADPFGERQAAFWQNGKWIGAAASYGCYREGQAPGVLGPSKEEIQEDLEIIVQHWNLIRVYNADNDTQRILEVIKENAIPLKVMLGIWLENEDGNPSARQSNISNVLRGIELANDFPDIVAAVNVGNETQVYWSGHRLQSSRLIRYLRAMRHYTRVPVTTADDFNFWNKPESKNVAAELDFICTHIYPLWNGITLEKAIPWLDKNYAEVQRLHPEKLLVLGEIGWATNYNPDKKGDGEQGTLIKGEVGIAAQEAFLLELDRWIQQHKVITFLFEVFDEPWKGGGISSGPREIEKNWGVYYKDRIPKQSFVNYLSKREQK